MPLHNRGGIKHFWRMLCIKYSRYGFYPHLTTKISTSDFHTKIFIFHFKNPKNYLKILRELSRPTKHKHCISTILNSPKITKIHHNIHSTPKQTLTVTAFSRTQLIFQKITYKTHYQNPENHVTLPLSVPT